MEEYLAFIDEIGRTIEGGYIYRFDFTVDTDAVWGDFFNVAPAVIIPDLRPDVNSLSNSGKVVFPIEMTIAKKNYCFSMQDCIDGIIPLMFSEIDENALEYENAPLYFRFGEKISDVEKKLNNFGLKMFDFEEVKKGDDSALDELIDSIDNENNDDEDDFE